MRVARYRLGEGVREGRYWEKEERFCRCVRGRRNRGSTCGKNTEGGEQEQEMVGKMLGENGEGKEWLRRLDKFRAGVRVEEGSEEGESE